MKLVHLVKLCACCHRAYTRAEFDALPYVGVTDGLTLRNCVCRSTLAVDPKAEGM